MRPTTARKLTCDDFLRLPGFEDDGLRHELIDGEHVVTPSPAERHQRVSMELAVALANYLKATGTGTPPSHSSQVPGEALAGTRHHGATRALRQPELRRRRCAQRNRRTGADSEARGHVLLTPLCETRP